MKDEIKKVINKLKYISNNPLIDGEYDEENYLFDDEAKLLLDCITNLQEENEKLKNGYCDLKVKCNNGECDCTNEEYEGMVQANMKGSLLLEDYKSRNEKAIEYIKEHQRKDSFLNLNEWQTRDLLNILNGGDDNE